MYNIEDLLNKEIRLSYLLHSGINKKLTQNNVDEIMELHRDICRIKENRYELMINNGASS